MTKLLLVGESWVSSMMTAIWDCLMCLNICGVCWMCFASGSCRGYCSSSSTAAVIFSTVGRLAFSRFAAYGMGTSSWCTLRIGASR